MSGRGETPDQEDEEEESIEETMEHIDLALGETLYTEEGEPVGTVRGLEKGGAFVTFREGAEAMSIEHARSGHEFGEATLMWRCTECGEMGDIEGGLPDECPNCGEPKEALMYWTED